MTLYKDTETQRQHNDSKVENHYSIPKPSVSNNDTDPPYKETETQRQHDDLKVEEHYSRFHFQAFSFQFEDSELLAQLVCTTKTNS